MTHPNASTQVLVVGGGPVGLAAAVELGRRGVACHVVEPRATVSHARPRCKTINVRTMEHVRRWGIEDRLRTAAPLSPEWSKDLVFCTTMSGYEVSRFTDVYGLSPEGDRFATVGQQAPQFVLEEVLREVVSDLPTCHFELGSRVTGLTQDEDGIAATVKNASGERTVHAEYVIGADGPRSVVRDAIGARYTGGAAMRPNFGCVFRAPELWDHIGFGRAVQYWVLNPFAPGVMGPLDGRDLWWGGFLGVDQARGERDVATLLSYAIGAPGPVQVLSTDPWTAKMQLVDIARQGRAFLAGDAAHLNPPWGGHGLNTGIGDAVDLGWKLAAVLDGWGGRALLESYVAERRPVHAAVIAEAEANMTVLPSELANPDLVSAGPEGETARTRADAKIHETKDREFHSLDLVLDNWTRYDASPVIVGGGGFVPASAEAARPGQRLPHVRLSDGSSIFDELGTGMTLLALGDGHSGSLSTLEAVCADRGVPLRTIDLGGEDRLRERYGCELVLVRPDQHVAWNGDELPASPEVTIDVVRGAAGEVPPA